MTKALLSSVLFVFTLSLSAQQEQINDNTGTKQYELGSNYFIGNKVKKDLTQGVYWLKEAAKKGHVKAQLNLAKMYYRGIQTKVNFNKAFVWAEMAANQNNPEAMLILADMYIKGNGVKRNRKKGILLVTKAKELGYKKAEDYYKTI